MGGARPRPSVRGHAGDRGRGVRARSGRNRRHRSRSEHGAGLTKHPAIAQSQLESLLGSAGKAIVLGIGGGGDVVGALASARLCQSLGTEAVVGGIAWERLPIDPHPGPRGIAEILNSRPLSDRVVLAGPETATPDGAVFAEAQMSRFLGQETLLIDILDGPAAVASSLEEAARALGARLIICVDVGGDVLANGSEAGLASPLCDAVMLAAAAQLAEAGVETVGAVFGPCCDGELTIDEILDRLAAVAAGGGLLGACGLTPAVVSELEQVVGTVPTEASAQAIRCARGEIGLATIRQGRRTVTLSPLGAIAFYFEPRAAVATAADLARVVMGATSLEQANDLLNAAGVRTELDYERANTEA